MSEDKLYSISLAGEWAYRLDPEDKGINEKWFEADLQDVLMLPGTLAENCVGKPIKPDYKMNPANIRSWKPKYEYVGACWYQKKIKIPELWKGKRLSLSLERIIEKSTVWFDGKLIGSITSLIAPHRYELVQVADAGSEHTLTIMIDNRDCFHLGIYGHSYTNETQTIWNGIVGKLQLIAEEKVSLRDIRVFAEKREEADGANVRISAVIENTTAVEINTFLNIRIREKASEKIVFISEAEITAKPGISDIEIPCAIESKVNCWDEFDPFLYEAVIDLNTVETDSCIKVTFGFRKLEVDDGILKLNGRRIFLRGNLENCIHPQTGYPPCDVEYWKTLLGKVKSYGLNHLRFHSNCPPEAAFEAADEVGVYLQIEGPIWLDEWFIGLGTHKEHYEFMPAEAKRVIENYGNHPSFCIYSNGNELRGDFGLMHDTIEMLRKIRPDILYTLTSNFDRPLDSEDDIFVSVEADKKGMRGNRFKPEMAQTINTDYSDAVESRKIPLVGHESGQFFNYPDIKNIEKFTGCIEPLNYEVIKKDLESCGLIGQADKYAKASGTLALRLYKEEIEAYLRTVGFGGFQLLGIQDFPGQCTATVGILDAFWDSKGLITAEDFRKFCSEVVPLIKTEKRVYSNNDRLVAEVMIANFSQNDLKGDIYWELTNDSGNKFASGSFSSVTIKTGTQSFLGSTGDIDLSQFVKPAGLKLTVGISKTDYMNSWDLWVFPDITSDRTEEYVKETGIKVFHEWEADIEERLLRGERILLIPSKDSFINRTIYQSQFYPVFWSPVFTNSKKPCGLYINKQQPFGVFPTDCFANYQWYSLLEHSFNIDIDYLPESFDPIIDIVPNYYYNHRLTNLLEAKVGEGLLLICTMQLDDCTAGDVGRWLKYSLLDYMSKLDIKDIKGLSFDQIKAFFKREKLIEDIREPFAKEDFID